MDKYIFFANSVAGSSNHNLIMTEINILIVMTHVSPLNLHAVVLQDSGIRYGN